MDFTDVIVINNVKYFLKYFLQGSLIGFASFLLYLELHPSLGNIWYRINSQNVREINFASIVNYLVSPFNSLTMWYPSNWDINPYIFTTGVASIYTIGRIIINQY